MAKPKGPHVMLPERPMLAARHAYYTGQMDRAEFTAAMNAYNDWVDEHGHSCGPDGATVLPDVPDLDDEPPALPDVGLGTPDSVARLATFAAAGLERLEPLQQRWLNAVQMERLGTALVKRAQQHRAELVHELTDHTALQLTEVAQLLGAPYREVLRAYHRGLGATCSP